MKITDHLALAGSLQYGLSGACDCSVWAIRGPGGVVLVDSGAGTATERILTNVAAAFADAPVAAVLLTHVHADHAAGAAGIRAHLGCPVFAPASSAPVIEAGDEHASGLEQAREQGAYPPEVRMRPCAVDRAIRDGERFELGGVAFTAIHVRGHSEDSFCYLAEAGGLRALFSGDAFFYGGVLGVINAPGSGMEGYRADLHKLAGLSVDALLPGHGIFTIAGGQRHIDLALDQARKGFLPRQIGQWDLVL